MRLTLYRSDRIVPVNIKPYLIDWDAESCSKIQTTTKKYLYTYWKHHIVTEEFRIPGSRKRIDFVNFTKGIVIEVSPQSHHNNFNKFFHKNRANFLKSIVSDFQKEEWATRNKLQYVELFENDYPLSKKVFEKLGVSLI